MMPAGKMGRLVFANTARNPKQFMLSAFGVIIGIGAFVFFLGLSLGIRKVVLEVFPLDVVEVIAPQASFAGQDISTKITGESVETIGARKDVLEAVPRMGISFPSIGRGFFNGNELKFSLVGDGIDPAYIASESFGNRFQDYEANVDPQTLEQCSPQRKCEGLFYCDSRDNKCHHRVPLIVSRNLLEIYNKQFAKSRGLPLIGGFEEFVATRGGLGKMRIYLHLGDTMVATASAKLQSKPRVVEATLLGLSTKAIPIGMTVPIGYVKRWNAEFIGETAAKEYSSVIVKLRSQADVAPFGSWVAHKMNLRLEDQQGERYSMIILIVTLLFLLISLIIITISAINIAHNLFMQVSERRREIGVMRALGATRSDIRGIILGEAAVMGFVSGVLGVIVAIGGAYLADWAAAQYIGDFAFKPETFFAFRWWIPLSGIGCSVAFCVLGGALPAERAAKLPPARALVQQ